MSTSTGDVLRAVYTDLDGTDFTAGRELLSSAGFEVSYLDSLDAETIVAGAADA
jgi:hypothetical protein